VNGLTARAREIGTWHGSTFPGKSNADVALKMAEEVGEVCGAQVRCDEIAAGTRDGDPEAAEEQMATELGDVMIVWLTLCGRHNLDPQDVLDRRWAEIEQRRWKSQA